MHSKMTMIKAVQIIFGDKVDSFIPTKINNNLIIAERNKLQAEIEALRKERDELLQFKEDVHNQYPASQLKVDQTNADFIVATYVGERHFKIPDDADRTKLDGSDQYALAPLPSPGRNSGCRGSFVS